MKILKKININLDVKITCRKCEELMIKTACLTESHIYCSCPKCKNVVVLDIIIEENKKID